MSENKVEREVEVLLIDKSGTNKVEGLITQPGGEVLIRMKKPGKKGISRLQILFAHDGSMGYWLNGKRLVFEDSI